MISQSIRAYTAGWTCVRVNTVRVLFFLENFTGNTNFVGASNDNGSPADVSEFLYIRW